MLSAAQRMIFDAFEAMHTMPGESREEWLESTEKYLEQGQQSLGAQDASSGPSAVGKKS